MVEMAGCLNRMVDHLHGKVREIRDGIVQAREAAVNGNASEATVVQLRKVERLIEDGFTL